MAQTDFRPDYRSRYNEQSRDERSEPQAPKTRTVQDGARAERDAAADEDLLISIRKDFSYCLQYWSYNREQAAEDMRFVLGQFWTQDETNKRAGRPCLNPDEISQYLKQTSNNYRQSKRAIKVIPRGEGATDMDAERRSAIIRAVQYASNAQAAYTTGFESAVNCGFGMWMVTTKRSGPNGSVEPRLRRIPNQFTALFDPDAREADFSDQNKFFVFDSFRESDFAERFPNATKTSFTTEDQKLAPDWFKGENIVVAEAWRRKRGIVTQYITNGVEILDEIPWPGSWIPAVIVVGEELYEQDSDGQSKRVFVSLTRRMKTPQKMLAFIASQEAEEFGMAPRSPLLLWEGQETADKKALENLHTIPRAFIRLKPGKTADGQVIADLPAGGRLPFTPNIEAYEVARESWKRSIQSAAGILPLPTAAQRQNEKSGIALERIQTQEAIGSYHFTDNMDRALEFTGRILNELITKVMDTPRSVGIRKADDSHATMQVSAQEHVPPDILAKLQGDEPMPEGGLDYLITDRGEFDVTLSTGPDFQSERDARSDFVDTLIKEAPALQLAPPILNKLVAIAVKMKDLGHFGDEIAKLLDPSDQTSEQLQQAQLQVAQFQQQAAQLAEELQRLKLEKAGKVIDNEYRLQIQQLQNDIKVLVAEITAKSQSQSERLEMFMQFWKENHGAAHEAGMQAVEHAHERDQAATLAATQAAHPQPDQPTP